MGDIALVNVRNWTSKDICGILGNGAYLSFRETVVIEDLALRESTSPAAAFVIRMESGQEFVVGVHPNVKVKE